MICNTRMNKHIHIYMPTYLHTYLHTYIQNPTTYIPLQTDIWINDYKQTPKYIQTNNPAFLRTYNTTQQPYPTTPTPPSKPYPTLYLYNTHTCAIKIKKCNMIVFEMRYPWEGWGLLENFIAPPKTCNTGRLPKQQYISICMCVFICIG